MSSQIIIVLPISKISSATTSAHTRPIPWDHDEDPNLQVVFERFLATKSLEHSPTEICLKIIRGREVLVSEFIVLKGDL